MELVRGYIKLSLSWTHLVIIPIIAVAMAVEFSSTRGSPDIRDVSRLLVFFELLLPMMAVIICAGGWPKEREEGMLSLTNSFLRSPARTLARRLLIQLLALMLLAVSFMTMIHATYTPLDWWVVTKTLAPNTLLLVGLTLLVGVLSGSTVVALGLGAVYGAVDYFTGGELMKGITLMPLYFNTGFSYNYNRLLLMGIAFVLLVLAFLIVKSIVMCKNLG